MAVGGSAAQSGSTDGEAERHLLEGELQEVECTLLGEMQQIERLAEENNEKVEELRGLKDDVKMLQERNEHDVSMLQDEQASAQQELAHRLAILREHATQLGLKHGRYTEAARINEEKGAEMESLLLKMEQRTKTHGGEVHAIRQEVLHLRQELESTFRKTLKDLGGTYRRKAFKALGSQAKEGMRTNKLLREELALQEVGVAALAERHVKQKKREGELKEQLKKLRRFRLSHQTCLFDLQREARANASSFADIQETKARISEARHSLVTELKKQGVPSCDLNEIREMALKQRQECQRLDKLKRRWQRRIQEVIRAIFPAASEGTLAVPSIASSTTSASLSGSTASASLSTSSLEPDIKFSSSTPHARVARTANPVRGVNLGLQNSLRGSKSAPPGLEGFIVRHDQGDRHEDHHHGFLPVRGLAKRQTAGEAWQARVRRVTLRWARDKPYPAARGTCMREGITLRSGDGDERLVIGTSNQTTNGDVAKPGPMEAASNGNRSASIAALATAILPSSRPTTPTSTSTTPTSTSTTTTTTSAPAPSAPAPAPVPLPLGTNNIKTVAEARRGQAHPPENHPGSLAENRTRSRAPPKPKPKPHPQLGVSASLGKLTKVDTNKSGSTISGYVRTVAEEDPWERKRRMERAVRRRDAAIRAKGLAVNSRSRSISPTRGCKSKGGVAEAQNGFVFGHD